MSTRRRLAVLIFGALAATASMAIAVAASSLRAEPPPGDRFGAPLPIGVSGRITGTTANAGVEPGEPGARRTAHTVWFTWVPTAPGMGYVLATRAGAPVQVHVYTGARLRRLTRVDAADPGGQGILAAIPAFAGVVYRVQIVSGAHAGRFALRVVQPEAGPPLNATAAQATSLTATVRAAVTGPASAATLTATTAGAPGRDHRVYFRWRVPAGSAGRVRFVLHPFGRRLRLAASGGDASVAGAKQVTVAARPGETVSLAVAGAEDYFRLTALATPSLHLATAAPRVSCAVPAGWQRTNVAVRCRAVDVGGAGLTHPSQRRFALVTAVAPGTATASASTVGVTVCDRAGNCAAVGPFAGLKVDRASPQVSCDPVAPAGWRQAVTVNCTATDPPGGAGLAGGAVTSAFTLTATLASGQLSRRAPFATHAPICDLAGNCTRVPTPRPAAVDRRAPRVTCERPPAGWVEQATIHCRASDDGSGLASPGDVAFTLRTELGAGSVSAGAYTSRHAVCDLAGNCATAGPIGPIRVDRQPPVVTCLPAKGWVRGRSGSVHCEARDAGAGLASAADRSFALTAAAPRGSESPVATGTRRVCGRSGACTTIGPFTVAIDDRPPSIRCESVPTAWVATPTTVACTASDLGSGVAPARQVVLLTARMPVGAAGLAPFPRARMCDVAGNCALTPQVPRAWVDRQAPSVRCTRPGGGVHRTNVAVSCAASDGRGSGLADPRQRRFTLRTSVAPGGRSDDARTGVAVVCDRTGNCVTIGPYTALRVDRRRR